MNRLASRVMALSLIGLATGLLAVGVATGLALWQQERAALDDLLYASALAEAQPRRSTRWLAEHQQPLVEVYRWEPGDALVSDEDAIGALADEQARWLWVGEQRVLVLAAEPEDAHTGGDHVHVVVVAAAERVKAAEVLGPFLALYSVISLVIALAVGAALALALRRSLAPLAQAVGALDSLDALELHGRLDVGGPAEVDSVLRAVNGLLERIEREAQTQSRFVADAAHELRTPVARVVAELDLVLRQPRSSEDYQQSLARLRQQATSLAELVEALLVLARLDAGQARADRVRERLSALLMSALAAERATLEAAGCAVSIEVKDDPVLCLHEPMVRMALSNLLRNVAVHAPGVRAQATVDVVDGAVEVRVDDAGPGLTAEQRSQVVERFRRLDNRRSGLGLGLSLVREVALHHGGALILADAPLGGLSARFRLSVTSA